MPIRKPVPAVLPWLTALAAAPLVLIVAAVAATRFGGVDLAVSYDLLTWTVARILAWVGLAAALFAGVLALRDLKGRGLYALAALVLSGAAVAGFVERQVRDAAPTPRDATTNAAEPPAFSRVAALHRNGAPQACPGVEAVPTQLLAQQAASALVDAGFVVTRATTFEVEGVHQGAWFGFVTDAVVRIRPGRTDVRVAARDARPDGGAACRLAARIVGEMASDG